MSETESTDQDQAAGGPRTYRTVAAEYGPGISKAHERHEQLMDRALFARAVERATAQGQRPRTVREPLTLDEYLEYLALGEMLARFYRPRYEVGDAFAAGASVADVALALDISEDQVRERYGRADRLVTEGQA
jgi:hypothetical protein